MNHLPKHIHIIGICGVATSAIAIAFQKSGVTVTGSDKGFFPPVSTELEKHGINFYAGWHPEKMIEHGVPDTIMIGTASGSQNPETAYAKEHNIPTYSYPEIIGNFFAKENSIVCAGTWGKTSSSAMLSYILSSAKWDPTYMFGGISLSHESSAKITASKWSVFEGDEYKSSPTDTTAKFFHYKATHLLLTAVSWDHADLYPTESDFFNVFKKLLASLPQKGFIVACKDNAGTQQIIASYGGKIIWYGKESIADYYYKGVEQSDQGLDFTIHHGTNSWEIHSPMLGEYQAENITGCFAMAHELGIKPGQIVKAIGQFKGLKRRMEKRLDGSTTSRGITIIDDIAHSAEKATSVLATLREIFKGKIIVVFEPNIGGRKKETLKKYDNAFKSGDMVVIPRLTKLKTAEDEGEQPIEGDELAEVIGKTHENVHYIESDERIVSFLKDQTKKGDVVAFLGSHGFRGMIENIVDRLH